MARKPGQKQENKIEELSELKGKTINDMKPSLNQEISISEQSKATRRQICMVVLGNIGVLSLGMGLGVPTVTLKQLMNTNEDFYLTLSQATWFASLNSLVCPLGGILSGMILDKIGRKKTLFIVNLLALIAWALMALAIESNPEILYKQLLVSRFLIGISNGLCSAPMGVYAAEISFPKLRGHLILGTSLSTAIGIMFIYLLGYFIREDWRLIAVICCVFQICAIFCVLPLPETPSWLISKGHLGEAKKSINYFRGLNKEEVITHPEVLSEYNLLKKTIQLGVGERKPTLLEVIRLPEVYKPIIILIILFTFQQITGIFVVVAYAVQIATDLGVSIDPFMCAIFLGLSRVLTTCPMGFILQKLGRRKAGMISAGGVFVCMNVLAGSRWFEVLQMIPYLSVITIVLYMVLSTIGLYTLPFIMISELFPQKARGPAAGVTVAVGFFVAFICIKSYPLVNDAIGIHFTLLIFGQMGFLAFIFIYFFLPETNGCTLLEIEESFRNGKEQKVFADEKIEDILVK